MGRFGKFAMRGVAALALATSAAAPATALADETCKIEYLGGAEAMVVPDEDIFAQFGTMMPGDENSGIVDVRNSGDAPAKLWFWAEEETRTGGAGDDMLDEIVLEIVDMASGDSIYAGPLNPEGLAEPILLGTYEPGQSAELAYNLLVPDYLGNDFMESTATVIWTFAAEEIVESAGGKGRHAPRRHLRRQGSVLLQDRCRRCGPLGPVWCACRCRRRRRLRRGLPIPEQ